MQIKIKHKNGDEEDYNLKNKEIKQAINKLSKKDDSEEYPFFSKLLPMNVLSNPKLNPNHWQLFLVKQVIFDLHEKMISWQIEDENVSIKMPHDCEKYVSELKIASKNGQIEMIEAFQNYVKPNVNKKLPEINSQLIHIHPEVKDRFPYLIEKHEKKLRDIEAEYRAYISNIDHERELLPSDEALEEVLKPYQYNDLNDIEDRAETLELQAEMHKAQIQKLEKNLVLDVQYIDKCQQLKASEECTLSLKEEVLQNSLYRINITLKKIKEKGESIWSWLSRKRHCACKENLYKLKERKNAVKEKFTKEEKELYSSLQKTNNKMEMAKKSVAELAIDLKETRKILHASRQLELKKLF